MRRLIAPALALGLATAGSGFAADAWTVDKKHSDTSFQVRHLVSKVRGRFTDFDGNIVLDRSKPEASSVEFAIQTASIDTANSGRDDHLRSPDFFDATKYPTITFKSSKIVPRGKDAFDVTGLFSMHGVSKEMTLPVTFLGFMKDPGGAERAGFETTATLNRKDFGVIWNKALDAGGYLLGDDVVVSVALELVQKKDPPPAAK